MRLNAEVPAGSAGHPVSPSDARYSRILAGLTGVAALAHLPLAVTHLGQSLWLATTLAAMSLLCLPCAGRLWRDPGRGTWRMVVVLGSAMIGLHLLLLTQVANAGVSMSMTHEMAGMHDGHQGGGWPSWPLGVPTMMLVTAATVLQVIGGISLLARQALAARRTTPGRSRPAPGPGRSAAPV